MFLNLFKPAYWFIMFCKLRQAILAVVFQPVYVHSEICLDLVKPMLVSYRKVI